MKVIHKMVEYELTITQVGLSVDAIEYSECHKRCGSELLGRSLYDIKECYNKRRDGKTYANYHNALTKDDGVVKPLVFFDVYPIIDLDPKTM